jgi:hypothetical protein
VSVNLSFRAPRAALRACLDLRHLDVRWMGGAAPPDPLVDGTWSVYRDRLSTRATQVEIAGDELRVRVHAGASDEDWDLVLAIVGRAAGATDAVDVELFGPLALADVPAALDAAWRKSQRESAARAAMVLAREQGPIQMPGPTRAVWIGPRVVAELAREAESERGELLVRIARRVLWPDPRYESAAEFVATGSDGSRKTLAILLPERACVLPRTDLLALEEDEKPFLVPRAKLTELPVVATPLDDGNDLVEPVPLAAWPRVCAVARRFARE